MRFNKLTASGFFVGFFGTTILIRALATLDTYLFFSGAIGIALSILAGYMAGGSE